MEGSGHVDIGFGGGAEVSVETNSDNIRLVIDSTGDHTASMSAVLDSETARDLAETLLDHTD
ncbi:hypothetical protein [Halorubrum sp. Eb13]|uniref:hypothetical protein n=1 Tax=Halorubrum sp. Eb13 TaxID=1383843 RepID=UPI0011408731|nr:hypothetical protein [Halorubrum sp. Eb13]